MFFHIVREPEDTAEQHLGPLFKAEEPILKIFQLLNLETIISQDKLTDEQIASKENKVTEKATNEKNEFVDKDSQVKQIEDSSYKSNGSNLVKASVNDPLDLILKKNNIDLTYQTVSPSLSGDKSVLVIRSTISTDYFQLQPIIVKNPKLSQFNLINDDKPKATDVVNPTVLNEANIPIIGSSPAANYPSTSGSLLKGAGKAFGADGGGITNVTISGGTTLTGANTITVTTAEGNVLVVNRLNGNYAYTLKKPLQHVNNQPIKQIFNFEFTDGDGTSNNANLSVTINDDVPVAKNKSKSANETAMFVNGAEILAGNVITDNSGFGVSSFGADGGFISAVNGRSDAGDGLVDSIIHVGTTYGSIIVYTKTQNGHQAGEYVYILDRAKTTIVNDNIGTVTDNITYILSDKDGSQNGGLLTISIALNRAPIAVDDTAQIDQNNTLNVTAENGLLVNDSDPNSGDTKVVKAINGFFENIGIPIHLPSNALLQVNSDGSYSYNPNNAFANLPEGSIAKDSFSYTMSDAEGLMSTASVSIQINGVNDAVKLIDYNNIFYGNQVFSVKSSEDPRNLLFNETHINKDIFYISKVESLSENVGQLIKLTSGALLTVNVDGTFTYDPNGVFEKVNFDHFSYEVTDKKEMASKDVSVTITNIISSLILDLDNDKISFISPEESKISFSFFEPEKPKATGWYVGNDGLLAIDLNENKIIDSLREFTFIHPKANSTIEALRILYHSNFDGILDIKDKEWTQFGIWQDTNHNGLCEEGEFLHLEKFGIKAIALEIKEEPNKSDGNTIYGYGTYQTFDEQNHLLADVGFGIL